MDAECYRPAPRASKANKSSSVCFDEAAQWEALSSSTSVKLIQILQILQKISSYSFPFSLSDFPNSISANALSNRMCNFI